MEVVLQGALPTAARDAQRCKVSPSCVWMTTQASATGADDLSIWTTRRESSTDGTGADAGLYSLLATLPSISAHLFLADTEITDPHSFLLSTENTSFAAADAGECLVALGANDTVTILLSVRHTGNNDQDTKEQQSSDETQASSSSFKFEPLHDNSHVMKSTLHLDWLFADTVDAEVEDVQIVPISKQQFLVLSYPHFSIVTINAEEQRCTVEHVRTIDGDLSWTDVHCSRDARPLVCASGSELVLLHASHMVEVVDVSTTAAVAAVINLRTCCTIYRGLEWSSIAVGWQPRRLLVSSASEPVTIVIDIPAYFSSFPQHLRPGAAAPLVRRSHTDGSGCDALPVMSIDDYHNEWIEAVRARVDIDSGFTHGTMRGDETRHWAAAANQHDHDHDHDGHRDGGADVSVGEAQYNASVLDALNATAASFITAASHLPPPPRPHPFAHLLRSQGTAATHVHVRNRRATVIASGVQHTLSITIVDVVTLQSLTTVVLPPSTHVANSNPLLLVGPRGLTTLVLDLSQQQLLDQLTMLGRNDVAQLLCSQNGWSNNCYTSQLETSLKYRQIELVKEVLKTLTKDQLASACEMLVDAVSETWQFRDYLDFPIKLMHLTTRFIARKLEMFAATPRDAILVQLSSFMARLRRILPLAEGAADVSGGGGGGEEDARAGEDEETTPTPGQQAGEQPPTCLLSTQLSADRAVMCLRPHFTRDDLSSIPKTLVDTWEDLADPAAIIAHALKCNRLLHAQVYLAANRLDPALHSIANTQHHALAAAYAAVRRAHTQLAATYLSSAGIEPYGCFAEIVRTTLESDVRERLWQQLVDNAPHETLALVGDTA
ncbi:hypothetical protein PTSG_11069 [Salpingoeca rosetta]|uniref:Uncharacterized protein n=1 Tax=Salpingoeca rosetta (strain ATCC 50818 / BSB-021) TaxID=946362 RepID=F2US19_SALR5|nr:uncharacterized protein PTSG_11069 [Salpingoeca rosetta]EGD80424.1 hypothetical protein PTSG_11069 [Salpingoeca rosetta]|eukprot:XP_004987988.1 hypothetical protein PTSG_11069 [Salpingoeca rosetta]